MSQPVSSFSTCLNLLSQAAGIGSVTALRSLPMLSGPREEGGRCPSDLWVIDLSQSPDLMAGMSSLTERYQATVSFLVLARTTDEDEGQSPAPTRSASSKDRPSAREKEALRLASRGFSNAEIAQRMGVSVFTVSTHLRSVYCKLGVRNRSEAAFEARHSGWLD